MPTTSAIVAQEVLQAIADAGVGFVVLGDESAVEVDPISDVDLGVDRSPADVVHTAGPALEALGYVPVVFWRYDRPSVNVFFSDAEARRGAQIDLTYDPDGVSRYGFRTGALIDRAVRGRRWMLLGDLDTDLYRLRKRQVKRLRLGGDAALDNVLGTHGAGTAAERVRESYGSPALEEMLEALGSETFAHSESQRWDKPTMALAQHGSRFLQRIQSPIGSWVHLDDADLADRLVDRLAVFLMTSRRRFPESPVARERVGASVSARRVLPLVTVSSGPLPRLATPDATIAATSVDDAARQTVAAMYRHTQTLL